LELERRAGTPAPPVGETLERRAGTPAPPALRPGPEVRGTQGRGGRGSVCKGIEDEVE